MSLLLRILRQPIRDFLRQSQMSKVKHLDQIIAEWVSFQWLLNVTLDSRFDIQLQKAPKEMLMFMILLLFVLFTSEKYLKSKTCFPNFKLCHIFVTALRK